MPIYLLVEQLMSNVGLPVELSVNDREGGECTYETDAPVLMTHCPSSLTRTHWLASSNSKSCRSSIRLAYSGSFLRLRFRFFASHSGRGRAVDEPEMVYTGTAE